MVIAQTGLLMEEAGRLFFSNPLSDPRAELILRITMPGVLAIFHLFRI